VNRITEEIRKVFIHYKRNNPSERIEDAAPFTGDQLWMNYYLSSGEAIMFPCWVLTNKVVLKVMRESGII